MDGTVKLAKKQGMIAAYLNVAAIVAALGLVLGLYGPVYTRNQFCNDYRNGYFANNTNYYERICRYS